MTYFLSLILELIFAYLIEKAETSKFRADALIFLSVVARSLLFLSTFLRKGILN